VRVGVVLQSMSAKYGHPALNSHHRPLPRRRPPPCAPVRVAAGCCTRRTSGN
jgi:hypothetical protein